MAENQEPVKVEEQGPFIHQLQLFLVGGQQFTVNELSDSVKMPQNVIAFNQCVASEARCLAQPEQRSEVRRPCQRRFALRISRWQGFGR